MFFNVLVCNCIAAFAQAIIQSRANLYLISIGVSISVSRVSAMSIGQVADFMEDLMLQVHNMNAVNLSLLVSINRSRD